jgi:hypothetical protein
MRLDLETEIRFPTGERAGILKMVILDANNQASHVVMATGGLISRDLLVLVDLLSEGEGGVLYINVDDLDELPDYEETRVPAAPDGWEMEVTPTAFGEAFPATMYEPVIPVSEVPNVPGAATVVTQGTEVWCLDERWGVVDEVVLDENDVVKAFVGRPDDIEERDLLIPIELVSQADADRVELNCTAADLPTYAQPLVNETEEPEAF